MGNGRVRDEYAQGKYIFRHTAVRELNQIVKLVTMDGKKTVIAEFHRARCLIKKRKARLEIQPAGMEMLDSIVLTFVFAETKRREREAAAKSAGGG